MKKNIIISVIVLSMIVVVIFMQKNKSNSSVLPSDNKDSVVNNVSGHQVTFLELGSVKCIPCKMMQPVMDEIEKDYVGKVKVVFHDVWTAEGKPYGKKYAIKGIPTQIFLDKTGKEFFRHTGFFPKKEIEKVLASQGITK